uniref:hypothetical protein n=1 Tax=Salmonella sp. s51228 TaxID=3159652 RepID=UPI00397FCFD6
YHRMSLLKSYDASMTSDFDYSQMQTYENPMWLHPYEQWDDGSQESNPLFYESQEFVMDMFKDNVSTDISDGLSYQSWNQTKGVVRTKTGRTGVSQSSTITRMSAVDQDYNVELLAEVLGDDLPPSTDEGSEITSI